MVSKFEVVVFEVRNVGAGVSAHDAPDSMSSNWSSNVCNYIEDKCNIGNNI